MCHFVKSQRNLPFWPLVIWRGYFLSSTFHPLWQGHKSNFLLGIKKQDFVSLLWFEAVSLKAVNNLKISVFCMTVILVKELSQYGWTTGFAWIFVFVLQWPVCWTCQVKQRFAHCSPDGRTCSSAIWPYSAFCLSSSSWPAGLQAVQWPVALLYPCCK